jgi:hypothetical protein
MSKYVREDGNEGNPVIPEGVVNDSRAVNPDKSCKRVSFDELTIPNLVREEGNGGNSVSPEPVYICSNPVNPDKSGSVDKLDDADISKNVREDGNGANPVIPEGVDNSTSVEGNGGKLVIRGEFDKSNLVNTVDLDISKVVKEDGSRGKYKKDCGVIILVKSVNVERLGML